MESVLNKIRDTVSSTVIQVTNNLSTALPGNPLTREYDLNRHVASAGPHMCFKIYNAVKKSTKEEAAVFMCDKKTLDQRLNKKDKEVFLDIIRKGVNQLTRLRHPSLLTIHHNIEESRDSIAFATEPVMSSLANLLGNRDNTPTPLSPEIDNYELFDVEIKYGLLKISEGLAFLHNDCKLLHRNLSPESIVVNRNGVWKIAGFDFCAQAINASDIPLKFPHLNAINYMDTPAICQPNPDYIAPDYLDRDVTSIETNADMFSLGLLTYTLYNKGKPLLPSGGNLKLRHSDQFKRLPDSTFSCIPDDSRSHIKLLLSLDTRLRPDAIQFSKLHFFDDILVKTLQYLDALYQWDNLQKSQFYKGLPEVLSQMPKRVKLNRVVSSLAKEYVNPDMVPFVLPNILLIAKETDDEEFHKWIIPDLVSVFKMREPIQIGIILMQNMDFLVSKFKHKPESLREHILPLVYRCLESDAQQIQELCLSVIPSMAQLIDYTSMKNSLLPKIKNIILNTKLLSVRVNALVCLGKILEYLDKWVVIDEVLPTLSSVPSREPAVIMASIAIIKITISSNKLGLTKEVMANKVIPYLAPLTIENGLSLQQFQTIMSLIRDMLCKVEDEQQIKLQQLNSIKSQQDSLFNSTVNITRKSPTFDSLSSFTITTPGAIEHNYSNRSATALSLEDKERLAKQNEQNERLSSQSTLVPQTAKPVTESHQPKDLTSTLMNSNLTNLSLNSRPQQSFNNSFTSPMNSQFSTSFPIQTNSVQFPNTVTNAFHAMPIQQQTVRTNMSSFDNLVIPELKKPMNAQSSQPMGTMTMNPISNSMANNWTTNSNSFVTNNTTNLGFSGNQLNSNTSFGAFIDSNSTLNSSQKTTKPLSKSELEDFLG
ncbi:SCY1-like protein 2 [Oppia nitens]|uniref:SCY1-like protein 2 n=1 Tax=Oppia nitens TaxID=1686743 RepID=UPI0023DA9C6E|nr:SCY1-like protein 2 [Oppia nitens]